LSCTQAAGRQNPAGLVTGEPASYNQSDVQVTSISCKESFARNRKLIGITTQTGVPPYLPASPPEFERSSVAHPEDSRTTSEVAADRLRLIEQRLQDHFYEVPPAAERIAASVLAELQDLEQSASPLSQ
jgi:hypothetical protein